MDGFKFNFGKPVRTQSTHVISVCSLQSTDSKTFSIYAYGKKVEDLYSVILKIFENCSKFFSGVEFSDDFIKKNSSHVIVVLPSVSNSEKHSKSVCVRLHNYTAQEISDVLKKIFIGDRQNGLEETNVCKVSKK